MLSREQLMAGPVAVLLGGDSAEREVSLKTGAACAGALRARGFEVVEVDAALAQGELSRRLSELAPVAAFNALHGRWGEDGAVQGLLECLRIPYTGSGVTASAVGMDKVVSKHVFASVGLPTPEYLVLAPAEATALRPDQLPFGIPCVVKPAREGSSVGISIVKDTESLAPALELAASFDEPVLIERYIKGRELAVAVLEGEALGAIEIRPKRAFYDYAAKYDPAAGTEYLFPAPIDPDTLDTLKALAQTAHTALGCRGVTRSDFLLSGDGRAWLIELNTLPGCTATSLVPKIAAGAGVDFETLCERLLLSARLDVSS